MINRGKFISIAVGTTIIAGATPYLLSDKINFSRADLNPTDNNNGTLKPDEKEILFLASLAPSGHNTQPWFIHYLEPYHWIIGNDSRKWLPAVDPTQRETILSLGAFIQNLDYAAGAFGYACDWSLLATTNQDERVMEVKLNTVVSKNPFDISKIKDRRTVRSNFLSDELKKEDIQNLVNSDSEFIHYLPHLAKRYRLRSALLLHAFIWWAWHLPAIVGMGMAEKLTNNVGTSIAIMLAVSLIPAMMHAIVYAYTWTVTQSLAVVTVYHAAFDEIRDAIEVSIGLSSLVQVWQMLTLTVLGGLLLWKGNWQQLAVRKT